jgi:hypothetical protein
MPGSNIWSFIEAASGLTFQRFLTSLPQRL